jgi:hypothetical protein
VVLAVFFNCSLFFVVLVIYGNASGAPTPYHFPVVSIKSTTVPRRYPLPFPFISTRFWWFLLVLVFGFHHILVVVNSFGGFGCFFKLFVVFRGFGNLW